jgi:hypothetical protein
LLITIIGLNYDAIFRVFDSLLAFAPYLAYGLSMNQFLAVLDVIWVFVN